MCSVFISSAHAQGFTGGGRGGAGGDFEIWGGQGGGVAGQPAVPRPAPGGLGRGTDGANDPNSGTQPNGGMAGGNAQIVRTPTAVIVTTRILLSSDGRAPLGPVGIYADGGGSGVYLSAGTTFNNTVTINNGVDRNTTFDANPVGGWHDDQQ